MRYRVLEGIPVRDYEGVVLLEPLGSGVHVTWKSSFYGKPAIVGPLVRRSLHGAVSQHRASLHRSSRVPATGSAVEIVDEPG